MRPDLVVGPNGAGKSTSVASVLRPVLPPGTPFVNADEIAKVRFPGEELQRSRESAVVAEVTWNALLDKGLPLIAETVFSHPSKLELVDRAVAGGYYVRLHVLAIPSHLAVQRVRYRVAAGGHDVPRGRSPSAGSASGRSSPRRSAAPTVRRSGTKAGTTDRQGRGVRQMVIDTVSPPRWPQWAPPALRELA